MKRNEVLFFLGVIVFSLFSLAPCLGLLFQQFYGQPISILLAMSNPVVPSLVATLVVGFALGFIFILSKIFGVGD